MTTYLALRHRDPPGLLGLFALLIRWRLCTHYPHAGMVVGGQLFEATLARGVHQTTAPGFGWLLIPVDVPADVVLARLQARMGRPYDWLSLLAFVLPWRIRWSRADYCYEVCWYALTGEKPRGTVTPEDLALLALQKNQKGGGP